MLNNNLPATLKLLILLVLQAITKMNAIKYPIVSMQLSPQCLS